MFGGFILNGYQARDPGARAAREPDVVRLDDQPHPARRASTTGRRSCSSALVAVVLFVVGVEAFVRRDIGVTSAVPTPSLPRRARRPARARGPGGRQRPADGAGVGDRARACSACVIAGSGAVVRRAAGRLARLRAPPRLDLPGRRHRDASAGSSSSSSSSSGSCSPGSPRRRSSAAGRRTRRPAGSSCCSRRRSPGPLGRRRAAWRSSWRSRRHGARRPSGIAIGALKHRRRHRARRSSARSSWACTPWRWRGVGIAIGGVLGSGFAGAGRRDPHDRHVVRRHHRAGARLPGRRAAARADRRITACRCSASGTPSGSSRRSCSRRRRGHRGVGLRAGAT